MPDLNPLRLHAAAPEPLNAHSHEDWREHALCAQVDPNLFFPEKGQTDITRAAIKVCHRCPVQEECLRHALDIPEEGIWGGTTEAERKRMRSMRRAG